MLDLVYSTFRLITVYIIFLAKGFVRYELQTQNCQISWYVPTAYRKIAHFHFLYCTEFIRGVDEHTRVS